MEVPTRRLTRNQVARQRRQLIERHHWLCFVHRELLRNAPPGARFPDYEYKLERVEQQLRELPRLAPSFELQMEDHFDLVGHDEKGKPLWEPKARWRSDLSRPIPPSLSTVRRDELVQILAKAIGEAFAEKGEWPEEWGGPE